MKRLLHLVRAGAVVAIPTEPGDRIVHVSLDDSGAARFVRGEDGHEVDADAVVGSLFEVDGAIVW